MTGLYRTLAIGLLSASAFAAPALAEPNDNRREAFKFAFSYKSSALNDMDQTGDMYKQLSKQARRACRSWGTRSLSQWNLDQQCADDLVEQVVGEINAPMLNAFHMEQTGGRDQSIQVATR